MSSHAAAFNLARKNSVRNEPDLLQQNFMEEDDSLSSVNEKYCANLLEQQLPAGYELPTACNRFESYRVNLQRRNSDREDANIAFSGMNPNDTLEALRAREHGLPSTAKINRRMTSGGNNKSRWWY